MFENYLDKKNLNINKLSEEEYYNLLSQYLNIELIEMKFQKLNVTLIKMFNETFIKKYRFIPLRDGDYFLEVCICQSKYFDLNDDLIRMFPNKKIVYKLCKKSIIDDIISEFYDKKVIVDNINDIEMTDEAQVSAIDIEDKTIENSAGARQFINKMIKDAITKDASDIHINPCENHLKIKFRIDGFLVDYQVLNKVALNTLLTCLKIDSKLDIAEKRRPQDGQITIINNDRLTNLRLAFMNTIYGEKATIRILNSKISYIRLEELGFDAESLKKYRELITKPYGVILVTGPTGSGKSTTLYTSIREIHTGERSIITIEDPVEYKFEDIVQTEVNPKIGLTFASGLRSILRQDPDILLIGEIRDEETAEIAMRAANTGHLVLSTLHTNDALSTITRLKDMGVQEYIIGSSLIGIVNQRLIRKVCNNCKKPHLLKPNAKERYIFNIPETQEFIYYKGDGCEYCNYTGYKGRTLIQEILIIDDELASFISSNININKIREHLLKNNYRTIKDDCFLKIKNGITNFEEVLKYAI